jgi:hypothetical protein
MWFVILLLWNHVAILSNSDLMVRIRFARLITGLRCQFGQFTWFRIFFLVTNEVSICWTYRKLVLMWGGLLLGYYSISLRSWYLWCNMSTNVNFLNIISRCFAIKSQKLLHEIGQNIEQNWYFTPWWKIAGSGTNCFLFVDISHNRYKLRRDVEQTPALHWNSLLTAWDHICS